VPPPKIWQLSGHPKEERRSWNRRPLLQAQYAFGFWSAALLL
jgi:hypothetical protein